MKRIALLSLVFAAVACTGTATITDPNATGAGGGGGSARSTGGGTGSQAGGDAGFGERKDGGAGGGNGGGASGGGAGGDSGGGTGGSAGGGTGGSTGGGTGGRTGGGTGGSSGGGIGGGSGGHTGGGTGGSTGGGTGGAGGSTGGGVGGGTGGHTGGGTGGGIGGGIGGGTGGHTGGGTGGSTGGGVGGGAGGHTGGGTGGSTGGGTGGSVGGGTGGSTGGGTGGSVGGGTGGSVGGGTGGSAGGGAGGSIGGGTGGSTGGGTGGNTGSVNLDAPLTPGNPGTVSVTFAVRSDQARHPISPLIYGTNQPASASTNRYGSLRLGGNRLTAYNWENNASNAGSDYNYQNDGYLSSSTTPGAAAKATLDASRAIGATAVVTVPIIDSVAADRLGNGDVRNSGSNYLTTRFKQNRATSGGTPTATPNTTDAYVNQDDFVTWLEQTRAGSPVIISLDNEPDLWSDTHPEVHPNPVTYTELVSRTLTYAAMVKKVAPTIPVTGFVSYGFGGFIDLQSASDSGGKGEFIDYFLSQVRAAETTAGHKLVDYLDLHWYPEATGPAGRITGTNVTSGEVTARVQAPRSLWDTTYTESSWIASYYGGPIRLLPRLEAKIAANNPGTKLAFTEWNYGGGDDISGGVATADVLGIFGRESVGLATLWKLNGSEVYNDAAIRAFRNFDGTGGAFGDTSIQASSTDAANSSVYASVDSANPSRTVLVAINKATSTRTAGLTLAHPTAYSRLAVYTLTAAGGAQLVHVADVTSTATNAFRYDMPPMSVSVLVPMP